MDAVADSTLSLADLSFRYKRDSRELFEGLTHTFPAGQMTAICGPSGRGKSTLLYILGLMLRPTAGDVIVGGTRTSSLNDFECSRMRSSSIGFVFQDAALDPSRSVWDAVLEPVRYSTQGIKLASERAESLLRTIVPDIPPRARPRAISGGQAQRVAICRALVTNPMVILADEPTGNLDHGNGTTVLSILREEAAKRDRCVIIATHDPFVLAAADSVLEL